MAIDQTAFGDYHGRTVSLYTISNDNGLVARVTDFGARLVEMHVPDRDGQSADVVLGFDDLLPYTTTDAYFGATCGRYCNRIKSGRFMLDGRAVQLTHNEETNHLHGGFAGFDKQVWNAMHNADENSVVFSLSSGRGAEGYPGELVVTSKYTLTADNRLVIRMTATTDAPTILNMVHHSYWNLAGHTAGDVLQQRLLINGDFYTPVDNELMTTGEVRSVAGTPFDFRSEKPIGEDITRINNAGFGRLAEDGGGYDHNFILKGDGLGLRLAVTVHDPHSGRGLSLRTTEPGVQFYTGGYLNAGVIGKGDHPYRPFSGFTLETQKFPNSPNFSHFPSSRLDPGEVYEHLMDLQFTSR